MSNDLDPQNTHELFAALTKHEVAFEDPFVAAVKQAVQEYNELLVSMETSSEERALIVQEMDRRWGSLIGGDAQFTGRVRYSVDNEVVREEFLDGVDVVSNGFTIIGGDEDPFTDGPYRMVYHLHVPAPHLLDAVEQLEYDATAHLGATAEIEQSSMEFVNRVSHERAISWLQYSCPDLFDEIQDALFNNEKTEDEALRALRFIRLNKHEAMQDSFTQVCLTVHLNEVISLDSTVPYEFNISGLARFHNPDGSSGPVKFDDLPMLGYISEIGVLPTVTLNEKFKKYDIMLGVGLLSEGRDGPVSVIDLPLSSIRSMSSTRDTFYQN